MDYLHLVVQVQWIPASGGGFAIATSALDLGHAFGDAEGLAAAFGGVLTLDTFGRDFYYDLGGAVRRNLTSESAALDAAVLRDTARVSYVPLGAATRLGLSYTDRPPVQPADSVHEASDRGRAILSAWMQSQLTQSTSADFYFDAGPGRGTPEFLGAIAPSSRLGLPQLSLTGAGAGGAIATTFDAGRMGAIGLSAAWHGTDETAAGADTLAQVWVSGRLARGTYALGFSRTEENASLFRSSAIGAFGGFDDSRTQFLTLAGELPLAGRTAGFAVATSAWANTHARAGMFSNCGTVRARAITLGLLARDIFTDGDTLAVAIGQPLRVERAEVDVTRPVALHPDGGVVSRTDRVDARPSGREFAVELSYDRKVASRASITAFVAARRAPGHIAGAAPSGLAGMRLALSF